MNKRIVMPTMDLSCSARYIYDPFLGTRRRGDKKLKILVSQYKKAFKFLHKKWYPWWRSHTYLDENFKGEEREELYVQVGKKYISNFTGKYFDFATSDFTIYVPFYFRKMVPLCLLQCKELYSYLRKK